MTQDTKLAQARLDPAAVYACPQDVLNDTSLTKTDQIEILRRWAYDESEDSVAEEEGMPSDNGVTLSQVLTALHALAPDIDPSRRPPTKQGGIDPAAVHHDPE